MFFVCLFDFGPVSGSNAKLVCYYTSWADKRPGIGRFTPEDVDVRLCTHLIFAYGSLSDNRLSLVADDEEDESALIRTHERLQQLRDRNQDLKILLAIGGWVVGSTPFKDLTGSVFRMNQFVYDSTEFLRSNKFDGLDVDWAFPR